MTANPGQSVGAWIPAPLWARASTGSLLAEPHPKLEISSAVSEKRAPERSRASSLPSASRSSTRPSDYEEIMNSELPQLAVQRRALGTRCTSTASSTSCALTETLFSMRTSLASHRSFEATSRPQRQLFPFAPEPNPGVRAGPRV